MKDLKALLVRLPHALHKGLKLEAVNRNTTIQDLITKVMGHWLKEQEKYR